MPVYGRRSIWCEWKLIQCIFRCLSVKSPSRLIQAAGLAGGHDCKHNTGEGGYEVIKRLWQSGARPQAIAAANEPIALGIMRFLYEQDIRISEDIAIVSYEDSVLGGYTVPALTSVNIQKEYMGELAARIMLKHIRKG